MGQRGSGKGELSVRMRGHLGHIRACEASGEALKSYARRKGLSVHALYQAKRTLRKKGVWEPGAGFRSQPVRGGASKDGTRCFVEATVPMRPVATGSLAVAWRVRLPGGAVLESGTALGLEAAVRLLEVLGGRS